MAAAAGLDHPQCRIAVTPSCGAQLATAEMQKSRICSLSIRSRNGGSGLRRGIPPIDIFFKGLRKQNAGRRAFVPIYSAHPNLIPSMGSRSSSRALSRDFEALVRRGRGGAVKGTNPNGESEAGGADETTSVAGDIRPAGRNLGRRAAVLLGGSLWSGLGCCRVCEEAVAGEEWDYGGPSGPAKWEGMCTRGSKQSPVDITLSNTKDGGSLGVLNFVYSPSPVSIKNTGHGTLQVSFGNSDNFLRVRGHALQLVQFHFHAPSEHAFEGIRYPMEAHLVHRDPITRKIVVVGVMLDAKKSAPPNECLEVGLEYVPQEHGSSVDAPLKVSPAFLLPPAAEDGSRGYVHYGGSLTTPPCSEGVEWFVLDTPVDISSFQVVDFMHFSGDGHSLAFNSRPLQPLGERAIFRGP